LFLYRTRKDSNFKRPHVCATLFQIEKCWKITVAEYNLLIRRRAASFDIGGFNLNTALSEWHERMMLLLFHLNSKPM